MYSPAPPVPARRLPWLSALLVSQRSRWLYWVFLPWLVPMLAYLLVGPAYLQRPSSLVGASLVVLAATLGYFWLLDRGTLTIARRWPALSQTWPRVLLTTATVCGASILYLWPLDMFFAYFQPFGSTLTVESLRVKVGMLPEMQNWLSGVLGRPLSDGAASAMVYTIDLLAITALALVYEAFYLLGKWKESQLSYEQLRQANLQSQLQSLRGQISPHFLFNTFNSLSSLIAESPRQAEQFVDEIAKVYRYLLQTGEGALTPLATELTFIESYFHLLKTRHGAGLELQVTVAEEFRRWQLPPLTLQMLVENAVKHNVLLASRPLRITISTTPQGRLTVRNTFQPKATRLDSTHVGLSNIRARYHLLAQDSPEVLVDDESFTVVLPLVPAAP